MVRPKTYAAWRKIVLVRDGFKCVWCGSKTDLECDHIQPYITHPELRLDPDNGRTLCKECHKKTPNYGGRGMKRKRWEW